MYAVAGLATRKNNDIIQAAIEEHTTMKTKTVAAAEVQADGSTYPRNVANVDSGLAPLPQKLDNNQNVVKIFKTPHHNRREGKIPNRKNKMLENADPSRFDSRCSTDLLHT